MPTITRSLNLISFMTALLTHWNNKEFRKKPLLGQTISCYLTACLYSFLYQDALEYTMRYGLWGHAMVLASKMDKKVQNEVTNRFMKTMTDFDPIHTVYDHLSGRQPVALMTPDDWQRNLAAMVANPPRQHPQSNKRNMICLGDTLMTNDQVWAAHLCYTLAGERFGFPYDEKTKMALIGIDHRKKTITDQHIPLENLQMMEVLEYAVSLNSEDHYIPVLQVCDNCN